MFRRSLYKIAEEIHCDWVGPRYGAAPYIRAMSKLNRLDEDYKRNIVHSFLSNADTWSGKTAMRIKTELYAMLRESLPEHLGKATVGKCKQENG